MVFTSLLSLEKERKKERKKKERVMLTFTALTRPINIICCIRIKSYTCTMEPIKSEISKESIYEDRQSSPKPTTLDTDRTGPWVFHYMVADMYSRAFSVALLSFLALPG
jgi:hypothetical protein